MKKFFYTLFAILAFVACSKSDVDNGGNNGGGQTPPKQPEITLSTTAADFSTDGGSNVITFTSSEAWTAQVVNSRADEWCSIEPTSGPAGSAKITVTTTANDTPDDRTASIIIKAGTASKTINVSQKQKDALTVTSSKFEVSAEGGEVSIEVKTNIDFEYTIEESAADWVEYKATRALKTSNLVFEVKENDDTDKREAKIVISGDDMEEVVTIYQEGSEPSIILTENEFTVSSSAETIAVEVKSNVDVTVEIPNDVKWITENATRVFSTNTYYFDIEQNHDLESRTADIKFTNKENGIYEYVTVTQMQREAIFVEELEYEFGADGGMLDFLVETNVDLTITISDNAKSWIEQVESRALESKMLHFDIKPCSADENREGIITIAGKDTKHNIKVKQVAAPNQILYTSTDDSVITPNSTTFGNANIISNVCENGQGIITFDAKITTIPPEAFKSNTKLLSISLPSSVTSIRDSAFEGCESLASITIPESVTEIGYWAFTYCASLANVYITDIVAWCDIYFDSASSNPMSYGANLYLNNVLVENLVIPKGVTKIGEYAFWRCTSLVSIVIPEGVTKIGRETFRYCTSLENIDIPEGITEIGENAFDCCISLESIVIPKSVTEIGNWAFFYCTSLENIIIPEGVTKIGDRTFSYCTSLESFVIPDGVMKIGESAFLHCNSLSSVTVPKSITEIGDCAFYECPSLSSVYITDIVAWCDINFYSDFSNPMYNGANLYLNNVLVENLVIPEGIGNIEGFAFSGCTSLITITIPEGVTEIGECAFKKCTSLENIIIPEGVTEIGDRTFSYCTSLERIVIPKSVAEIGNSVFSNCNSLESVYCKPITPPLLGVIVFHSNAFGRKIYVPVASVDAYKVATNWDDYSSFIIGYNFE